MEGGDQGGAKASADTSNSIILSYLEALYDPFLLSVCEPNRGSVEEDWKDNSVEDLSPVRKVDATD